MNFNFKDVSIPEKFSMELVKNRLDYMGTPIFIDRKLVVPEVVSDKQPMEI